jgi:hypothetical protein
MLVHFLFSSSRDVWAVGHHQVSDFDVKNVNLPYLVMKEYSLKTG